MRVRTMLVGAVVTAAVGCAAGTASPFVPTPGTSLPGVTSARATVGPANRPDPVLTPGVVITTRAADVCTPGWSTAHRAGLSSAAMRAVLAAYRLPVGTKIAEWDHLVSLELGGGNGRANIWPQVAAADSARKDRLENALHAAVCTTRTMTLASAQSRIRVFWLYW